MIARRYELVGRVGVDRLTSVLLDGGDIDFDAIDGDGTKIRARFTPSTMLAAGEGATRVLGSVRGGSTAWIDIPRHDPDGAASLAILADSSVTGSGDNPRAERPSLDPGASTEYIVVGVDLHAVTAALSGGHTTYAVVHPSSEPDEVLAMAVHPTEISRPTNSDWVAVRGMVGGAQQMNMVWSANAGGWMRLASTKAAPGTAPTNGPSRPERSA